MEQVEKILCCDRPSDNSAMWAAMMANKNNNSDWMYASQMNNPMWLVWMMAMRWMYGNNDGNNNAQLAQIQSQISDNQSFNNMMSAISQNQNVMNDIATRTSTSIDFVRESLCQLGTAVQNVAGKTELSAERVANAVALGDQNIISQMLQCCCQGKQLIVEQGYQNQIATERSATVLGSKIDGNFAALQLQNCKDTGGIITRIDQLANGITQGFSATNYESARLARDTQDVVKYESQRQIDAIAAGFKSIEDKMCQNEINALRSQLEEKDRRLMLHDFVSQVRTSGNCGCNCNCGC